MIDEVQLKRDLCEVGRRVWMRQFVAANDGNFSIRIGEDEVLTTPTGVSKGFMTPEMICKVNLQGKHLEGAYAPSSEILLHLKVYRCRPDVRAVVHAHPPTATGFAVAGWSLQQPVLPEVIVGLGGVPLCPFALPGTAEVPESLREYLSSYDAFLLANHGALTVGADLFTAYYRMEILEHFAQVMLTAHLLGGAKPLSQSRVQELYRIRQSLAGNASTPPSGAPNSPSHTDDNSAREAVKRAEAVGWPLAGRETEEMWVLVERITAEVLRELRKSC